MEALYRKYRPKIFEELFGQENIKRLILNSLSNKTINHAYIFAGPRGTGKTTVARILAKSLNCETNQYGEPCNTCSSCLAISNGNHLDVLELDAASNRGIDEIRKIRDGVNFSPAMGKYKVYIIDEAHMLTREAFNALLKTLEEPPKNVVFILATTNPEKIPATITSRCHVLEFKNIPEKLIFENLTKVCKNEGIIASQEALIEIAKRSNGGMRDALSILQQVSNFVGNNIELSDVEKALGLVSKATINSFINSLLSGELKNVLEILEEIYIEKGDFETFIQQMIEACFEFSREDIKYITIAKELYSIGKELKNSEEVLLISKVLFSELALKISKNFENSVAESNMPKFPAIKDKKEVSKEPVKNFDSVGKIESNEKIEKTDIFEKKEITFTNTHVTEQILEELKLNGDLSLFVGMSLAKIFEEEDKIKIVFPKSRVFSYELTKKKINDIRVLYEDKSGVKRPVYVELENDEKDDIVKKLKELLGG